MGDNYTDRNITARRTCPPGRYVVTVERPGFKTSHVSDVGITVGLIATINVKLEVGAVQNEIRVETSAV